MSPCFHDYMVYVGALLKILNILNSILKVKVLPLFKTQSQEFSRNFEICQKTLPNECSMYNLTVKILKLSNDFFKVEW